MEELMRTKKILLCVLLSTLAACGSNNSSQSPSGPQADIKTQSSKFSVLITEVKYLKRHAIELNSLTEQSIISDERLMNKFIIDVTLKNALTEDVNVICAKMNLKSQAQNVTILAGTQKAKLEIQLDNEELDATLNCRIVNNGIELSTQSFNLEKTLIIKNAVHLKDLSIKGQRGFLSVDRLVFTNEEAKIITDGAVVNFKTNEIFSANGMIETFATDETQVANRDGLSGGAINIITDKAQGIFRVQMRGQNAGEQTQIPEKNPTAPAHSATTDAVADNTKYVRPRCSSRRSGGDGNGCGDEESYEILIREGHGATSGTQGNIGFAGFPGLNGGDSGLFTFISNADDFSIDVLKPIAGKGSNGGEGGDGSDGATGGNSAYRFGGTTYPAGANGQQGAKGTQGKKGNDGNIQELCFKNKQVRLCNK
jgi:hypothetical protein